VEKNANAQIRSILELADRMIVISEHGFSCCDDDGCLLLNGLVRESAYRLRDAAERELYHHGTQGNCDREPLERPAGNETHDASITAKVKMVLQTHRSTSSMKTSVETRNGLVTLTGIAGTAAAKSLVTRLVSTVRGVSGVKNRMTVGARKPDSSS